MPVVKSRFNGLQVNIPQDARGVVGRFFSQGGNELIFDQRASRAKIEPEAPLKVESEAPDAGAGKAQQSNGHEPELA
jgi:hypothetical protein